jgi:uncharacterized protein
MLPDVNVLVAAFRKDHAQHRIAANWLDKALTTAADGQLMLLPIGVISSFLRLVTQAKIFPAPTPIERAVDFIDWLLEDPKVKLTSTSTEWTDMRSLVLKKQLSANQIPDAQLAATCIHLSEPFVTFDKGFRQLLPPSLLVLLRSDAA